MPKPNKENIITDMLIELERGISYSDCLVLNGTKWNLPKTTFVRYWKSANERHAINQESTQKAIAEQSIEAGKERVKTAILTKEQRMKILTDIAQGNICVTKPMVVNGILTQAEVIPDFSDRKAAIAELNKMDGSYAPAKVENTNVNLNTEIDNIDYSKLPDNVLEAIEKAAIKPE